MRSFVDPLMQKSSFDEVFMQVRSYVELFMPVHVREKDHCHSHAHRMLHAIGFNGLFIPVIGFITLFRQTANLTNADSE